MGEERDKRGRRRERERERKREREWRGKERGNRYRNGWQFSNVHATTLLFFIREKYSVKVKIPISLAKFLIANP